jgi:hypothetical protein
MEQGILLVVAFIIILLGAELFTNGIEWVGHHLDLAEGAVGSVLAAVGTALPETMSPLVDILLGSHAGTPPIPRTASAWRHPGRPVHARHAGHVRDWAAS